MRLLIADDHELIRRGLRQLLHAQTGWQVVAEAGNGTEAVHKALQLKPDVAVLDYYMPGLDGIEAADRILEHQVSTKVVLLTAEDSPGLRQTALSRGVSAFLLKTSADQTLVSAICSAVPKHLQRCPGKPPATADTLTAALTTRETQVLHMLASGATSRQVAVQLGVSVRTVESHRANLNAKCGFNSVADLVRFAFEKTAQAATHQSS